MGVKSTKHLTREEAERKYVELTLASGTVQREIRAKAVLMNNTDLEIALEVLNDEANNGEGFDNYIISDRH